MSCVSGFFCCEPSDCSCRALVLRFMDEERAHRTKPGSAGGGILLPTDQSLVKLLDLHQITLCPRLKLIANPCPRMEIIPQCYHNGLVPASKINDHISCSVPENFNITMVTVRGLLKTTNCYIYLVYYLLSWIFFCLFQLPVYRSWDLIEVQKVHFCICSHWEAPPFIPDEILSPYESVSKLMLSSLWL